MGLVNQAGAIGRATFFMRAGYSGSQRYCPLMWAGDQNVDDTVPAFEGTFGGPVFRDRLWFFGAGRYFEQDIPGFFTNSTIARRPSRPASRRSRRTSRCKSQLPRQW